MPNTKDLTGDESNHSILLVGTPGSGKTTQYLTLPGRGFDYLFDTNALASLEGSDIDYEAFLPDRLDINLVPLRKSTDPSKGERPRDKVFKPKEPTSYIEFEKHFDNALESKMLEDYDWIGVDSTTNLLYAMMDRLLWMNGRLGKQPEQDDYGPQMTTFMNLCRTVTSSSRPFILTAHEEPTKDELTQRILWQPVMTGKLRIRIPILFANIWRTETDGERYFVITRSDRQHPFVRCSIKGLDAEIDVTIEDFKRPQDYGIGKILRKAGYFSNTESSNSQKQSNAKPRRK